MATVTIRRLEEEVKQRLRVQAALNGRSMEEEAREILRRAVAEEGELTGGDQLEIVRRMRGRWKGRVTTDEVMRLTRED